jgi:transposase
MIDKQTHKMFEIKPDFFRDQGQTTKKFDGFVIKLVKELPLETTGNFVDVSVKQVTNIMNKYCKEKDANLDFSKVTTAAFDETSKAKNHVYVTIVNDNNTSLPICMLDGNCSTVVEEFKTDLLSHHGKVTHIKNVSSDMFGGYRKGFKNYFPRAKKNIDKFHVIYNISKAFDQVRRSEYASIKSLKDCRLLLLKNTKNLKEGQQEKIAEVLSQCKQTAIAYSLKTEFEQFYQLHNPNDARAFFHA